MTQKSWTEGKCCERGKKNLLHKSEIRLLDEIFNLQLELFEKKNREIQKVPLNYSLKAISTEKLKIKGKYYSIVSAISHYGSPVHEGHYTSLIRNRKSWYEINGLNIMKNRGQRIQKMFLFSFFKDSKLNINIVHSESFDFIKLQKFLLYVLKKKNRLNI